MTPSTPLKSYHAQSSDRIGVWEKEMFLWATKSIYLYQNFISQLMLKCYGVPCTFPTKSLSNYANFIGHQMLIQTVLQNWIDL